MGGESKRRRLIAEAEAKRRAAGELAEAIAPPPKPLNVLPTPAALLGSDARGQALLDARVRARAPARHALPLLLTLAAVLGAGLGIEPPEKL